jgi:hypothetical protein
MDEILEHKIYRNEILKFHRPTEFCFKFKTWDFIAARRYNSKGKISTRNLAAEA